MKRARVAALWILAAAFAAFGPQDAGRGLPEDEQKLYEYAQQQRNQGRWQEGDRAYKAYLGKFPKGKHAEQVHFQLSTIHMWNSQRRTEAREWLEKLIRNYPDSKSHWNYRMQYAQSWNYSGQKKRAIEEYEKIAEEAPDASLRAQAIRNTWNLKNKYFYLNVNQSFTSGEQPWVNVNLRGIDEVEYRAYHIPYAKVLEHVEGAEALNLQQAVAKVDDADRVHLKTWTVKYDVKKQQWRNEQVKVPSTRSGIYIVEAEHEKVTFTVTLFASRYGIVTKAAAGKLLCFVQDRRTSRPVEGMRLRVVHKEHPVEGVTDGDGLFVSDGYKGGLVMGVKDGEVVVSQSYFSGYPAERPLLYFVTDRPIYRPNQRVQFRVIHRKEKGEELSIEAGKKVTVEIHDPRGNTVYEKDHVLGPFGSLDGSMVLGDEPSLGPYTIYARPAEANDNAWRWGRYGRIAGTFRVDEYRKPEYEVAVNFDKKHFLQGGEVTGDVEAKYYFGSPVVNAQVTYTIHRRVHWWSWRWWSPYYEWYAEEEQGSWGGKRRGWGWGPGQQVHRGTGRTDKDGKFRIRFKAEKWEYDAEYTVVAQVTDLSRRVVDGSGSVKATRAEFGLAMSLDKYVYKPGDRVNIRVRARTPDNRPVRDTKVKITVYDRRWKDKKYHDDVMHTAESRTDEHGIAEFNTTPDREGGYLYVRAEAVDARDNAVLAERHVWLCGNAWAGDTVNLNGIDLHLDKKVYDVGDTARVLVTSQYKNVHLLFTMEGKEVHRHRVVRIKGHTQLLEIPVEREGYAPNIFLNVIAIKQNQVVQKQKMLVVNPSRKFVTVEVKPDKTRYRPRQKAVYEVRTLGVDGKPVAAEVTLGIVDESIYALQEEYAEDIRKHFIHRRWAEVTTNTSLSYTDWGRAEKEQRDKGQALGDAQGAFGAKTANRAVAMESAAAPGSPAAKKPRRSRGDGAAYAATEIRSNFADTMIWKTVVTGADGVARIEVDIPDNLTTWRATARATTADSRFGQSTNEVICRKEVIVRLQAPRFFTQNDTTIVSAVAHNYLDAPKEVKIEFAATGIDVEGAKERIIRVEPKGEARIDWKARVRGAGTARITVKALTDEDSDAMMLPVPVLPHGALRWDSRAGTLADRVVEKIVVPGGAVKEVTELAVVVSPTHASMVLDALDYLAGYPYGCVEQTMSRFLPTVIVAQALQKLGIEKKELQEELPLMVEQGLQRLYGFQQRDGGWGWWKRDASNPWITGYVMAGLAMARNADHRVDANVFNRGVQALRRHLGKAEEVDERAYLLYALSLAGQRDDGTRDDLEENLSELKPYSKALLAMVMKQDGRDAKPVVDALARQAIVAGGVAHYEGGKLGRWMDHGIEETAAALRALLAVAPDHALVPKLVHWLSLQRRGNYWVSTKQTAWVVHAVTDYLAHTGDLEPDMTITLSLNGDAVYEKRVTKENWQEFEGVTRFAAAQLNEGENTVTIEKKGRGTPAWSIYLKHYAEGEDLPASEGGLRIERRYERVVYEDNKVRHEPLERGGTVTSGEEVRVTLTLHADRVYEWLMLEDMLPSGFEPIREYWADPWGMHHPGMRRWSPWRYWYSRKEFRDEKVSVGITRMHAGRHVVQYTMRAETPGDFHVLPATAFNMYHPGIGGNSDEFRVSVKDRE